MNERAYPHPVDRRDADRASGLRRWSARSPRAGREPRRAPRAELDARRSGRR